MSIHPTVESHILPIERFWTIQKKSLDYLLIRHNTHFRSTTFSCIGCLHSVLFRELYLDRYSMYSSSGCSYLDYRLICKSKISCSILYPILRRSVDLPISVLSLMDTEWLNIKPRTFREALFDSKLRSLLFRAVNATWLFQPASFAIGYHW